MKRILLFSGVTLAVAGLLSQQAFTQTPQKQIQAETSATRAEEPVDVDPVALSALQRMTLYLGTLKSFEVRTTSTIDEVMDTGQKLQFEGGATYRVRRPNAFYLETRSDRRVRQFFYDGKSFTVFSPRMNVYSEVSAPGTIAEVVTVAQENYDISLPLAELFVWGQSAHNVEALTSAIHVGFAKVGGIECDQYAFRQPDVDWQVWIQRGATPLPRKLVITTRSDAAFPQFTSNLDWNLEPGFDAATFDFKPPPDTYKIQLVRVSDTSK